MMKRPVILAAILIITSLVWGGLQWKQARFHHWLKTAPRAELEIYTKEHPDDPEALARLGILLRNDGAREESQKLLQHTVDLSPTTELYWIELSKSMDDQNLAIEKMESFLKIYPDNAAAQAQISAHLLKLGQISKARTSAEKATKLAPDSAAAWQALGDVMAATRRLPEAEKYYRKSIALDGDAEARLSLVRLLIPLQRYSEMRELCEPILRNKSSTDISPVQRLRAELYISAARLYDPLEPSEIASLQNQIKDVDSHSSKLDPQERFLPPYFLGESYLRDGKPSEAIPFLERSAALGPMYAGSLYSLSRAYRMSGNIKKADEVNRQHVRLSKNLRDIEMAMDRLDEHPGEIATMFRFADSLKDIGNKEDAKQVYQQIINSGNSVTLAKQKLVNLK